MSASAVTTELIINAYRQGYFPMAHGRYGNIGFYYFEPRGIIPLDEKFIVRRSLRKVIEQQRFTISVDAAFEKVMLACARYDELPDDEIWISEEMLFLYRELHHKGIAHSVEAWKDGKLVGGLYGLTVGSVFCGESMFSNEPFASQAALVYLIEYLRKHNYTLLDAQMESEHLKQFGLFTVPQDEYLRLLDDALMNQTLWDSI
ncbi:MAG TPA: leucyl/phenylalanyl-tRNA--protein transferase [Candidatus Kapabacteria bacterium]|nr:leucyl/phenylalanyl-tRNA--protein transferase [Candidatus Kapabacteria bacterium]